LVVPSPRLPGRGRRAERNRFGNAAASKGGLVRIADTAIITPS
jgi:hypothetical protein